MNVNKPGKVRTLSTGRPAEGTEKLKADLKKIDNGKKKLWLYRGEGGVSLRGSAVSKDRFVRALDFLFFMPERMAARSHIIEQFKSSGIPITRDIRKALPGVFRMGDTKKLIAELNKQTDGAEKNLQNNLNPASVNNNDSSKNRDNLKAMALEELKTETRKFLQSSMDAAEDGNGAKKKTAITSRENTAGSKAQVTLFKPNFDEKNKEIAQKVMDVMQTSLAHPAGSAGLDNALLKGYKLLLFEVSEIQFSEEFIEFVTDSAKAIDAEAFSATRNALPEMHEKILTMAADCKKQLVPGLMLRLIVPNIFVELNFKKIQELFTQEDNKKTTTLPTVQLATCLQFVINATEDQTKKLSLVKSIEATYPEFTKFINSKDNNLNNFTAFHELKKQIEEPPANTTV